ncbi:cytochrome d ubiquinol oxidase subunit II [Patulibacter americanus]|uniref:cytochrome d ubiquinol oxidase subunit II n=1 Tax=Patulibacter americanus TaxID=588672 RepID=UPI0003B3204C|nr:cytochrome d ubiquinol oxidase subunit II [Patulibacter americanus]
MAELCAGTILLGLTAYVVLAGADFGGGFWDLTAGGAERGGPIRGLVQRSMSPVWEANHVWLILILTVFWTGFPVAFGSVMSTLYVPLSAAAIGIIFRGAAFAFRGEAATIAEARVLGGLFSSSSVLVPFALGATVGAVASGRVPVGNAAGDPVGAWLNPTGVLIGVLSVAIGAYLAAVFLCADAVRAEQPQLVRAFRRRAVGAGIVTGGLALAGLVVLRGDARPLFDGLTHGWALVLAVASAAAGVATLAIVVRTERFGLARLTAAAAVVCLVGAWAVAQQPAFLPGALTIEQAAAGDATLQALLISTAIAVVVLTPSLWLLFRLVLNGTLDQRYEPLDQRFRPLDAGDGDGQGRSR